MISRRIIAAFILLCGFASASWAQPFTKAQLNAQVGVNFPDNQNFLILPSNARTISDNIINSILPTAPVVNGDLACFNGTTGLLKDCGVFPPNTTVFAQAACNGTTDDTATIAAAIASVPIGGLLVLPAGNCLVSGSGSAIFTITQPINIVGQGMSLTGAGTTIEPATSVPTTTDIFHIVPTANTSPRGFTFSKFNVSPQSGSVGQNVFHFDTTAGTTTNIGDIVITQVYANQNASAGGVSIFLDNGIGTNANGGEAFTTVQNSYLGGGIDCMNCGDSIRLLNNQILTLNAGFTIKQIAGAGGFLAVGNNIVAAGGNVIVSAVNPIVGPGNTLEQQVTNNEANNSILDVQGAASPKVFGNSIVGLTGTGNPILVRFDAVTGGSIENNYLGGAGTGTQLTLTSNANSVTVGSDNTFAGGGTAISDSGTGTVYAPSPSHPLPSGNGGTGSTSQTDSFTSCIASVNFNSANTDHAIAFTMPAGFTRMMPTKITIQNASHTLVTATFGVFSATAAGGVAIVASATAITVSATTDATLNNAQTTSAISNASFLAASLAIANTIQFRVGTAEGTAATADVCFDYIVRP